MSGYDEGLTYKVSLKFMQGVPEIHFKKLAPMVYIYLNRTQNIALLSQNI